MRRIVVYTMDATVSYNITVETKCEQKERIRKMNRARSSASNIECLDSHFGHIVV